MLAIQDTLPIANRRYSRLKICATSRERNRAGARTFLSAATSERFTGLTDSHLYLPLQPAADKNVRAPVPSGNSWLEYSYVSELARFGRCLRNLPRQLRQGHNAAQRLK